MPPPPAPRLPRRAALTGLLLLAACGPTRVDPLPGPPRGRVILLRGLANVFSTGLNLLTTRLRVAGYDATVHNHVEWRRLAQETEAAARQGRLARPLATIGHSFGADDAVRLGVRLAEQGIAPDLVVCFDPTAVRVVPRGPRLVVNFHQEYDPFSRILRPGPDFDGRIENRLVEGESHLSIEKSDRLHAEVLALLATLPEAPSPPAPRQRPARRAAPLPVPPRPPIRAG